MLERHVSHGIILTGAVIEHGATERAQFVERNVAIKGYRRP